MEGSIYKAGIWILLALMFSAGAVCAKKPVYIAFLWHMHQPIYWPGENIMQTSSNPSCTDHC
ncbi:MAG: hypothetical protein PHW04_18775, partial [Candidatus Wallbacteria bacterium]|nr:hypothetical protein [Candidatus Wallbacteria bacterium]